MYCPRLGELPVPPYGKNGWPWTEETPRPSNAEFNSLSLPKISIVTPNYNYGHFIEETIRSVLLQGYPNLEYTIMDGGSTDGSIDVIKKYEKWITYWVSEPDHGQTKAINKGFSKSTGDILGWLNSDDVYLPNALNTVGEKLMSGSSWIMGRSICKYDEKGQNTRLIIPDVNLIPADWVERFLKGVTYLLAQPAVFWKRNAWDICGPLKEHYEFTADQEFFLRVLNALGNPVISDHVFARCFLHKDCKTLSKRKLMTLDFIKAGLENRGLLPIDKRCKALIIAASSRSRVDLYPILKGIDDHEIKRPIFYLAMVFKRHPILFFDRMFWGFLKKLVKSIWLK